MDLEVVTALLSEREEEIDLAAAKLPIDRLIDPSLDIDKATGQLDSMAAEVRAMVPRNASADDRLHALRKFIYEVGPWNGWRPFSYDLVDPFGRQIAAKLLPNYLCAYTDGSGTVFYMNKIRDPQSGCSLCMAKMLADEMGHLVGGFAGNHEPEDPATQCRERMQCSGFFR